MQPENFGFVVVTWGNPSGYGQYLPTKNCRELTVYIRVMNVYKI